MNFLKAIPSNKLSSQTIIPILFGIIIFLVSFSASTFNDPDFDWHLKTGEIIVKERQLPSSDLFSYTMTDYRWINYEYLFHIFIWLIYLVFGIHGIAAAFALLNIF